MEIKMEKMRIVDMEIDEILQNGLLRFWLEKGIDRNNGGYVTCFDSNGIHTVETEKYLVTQTRMLWAMSALAGEFPDHQELRSAAKQGYTFICNTFWDAIHGGWIWKTTEKGECIDNGKVVYGQSFAIYALVEYAMRTGNKEAMELAEQTFNLMQIYAADTEYGGYLENFEPDWSCSDAGSHGGDRKSLDVHLHIMEAFTVLAHCTGKEIHRRKLAEVINVIVNRMIDTKTSAGLNQFDRSFKVIPPINIRRTWNEERKTGASGSTQPSDTSYGHNLETVWLISRALSVLGNDISPFLPLFKNILDHTLMNGFDFDNGGVYRDGPLIGKATNTDKEWWQNCEALVGFLSGYEMLRDEHYLDAFFETWRFVRKFLYNPDVGEFRQLVTKTGDVLVGDVGNPWKALYHSGRSLLECKHYLARQMSRIRQ